MKVVSIIDLYSQLIYNEAANIPIIVVTIMKTIKPIIQSTIPEVTKESPLIIVFDFEFLSFSLNPIIKPITQKNIPKKFNIGIKLSIKPIIPITRVATDRS
ncbi:hypothetical protein [Clostridium acidisoli]|jgi:hypothetical protein|uniref:hypothetical protein n=1 Tax=Clostridium acidisoli TaxID=91624 RepID=UPI001593C58B|nr:hypothetical protein [Clostridium acidisoli]